VRSAKSWCFPRSVRWPRPEARSRPDKSVVSAPVCPSACFCLGALVDGDLRYVGRVGSGFDAQVAAIARILTSRKISPTPPAGPEPSVFSGVMRETPACADFVAIKGRLRRTPGERIDTEGFRGFNFPLSAGQSSTFSILWSDERKSPRVIAPVNDGESYVIRPARNRSRTD
jgi:hypothetical protein